MMYDVSDVPYHNSVHAADVTQSTHVLLNSPALEVKIIYQITKKLFDLLCIVCVYPTGSDVCYICCCYS